MQKKTILIIEDNELNLKLFYDLLAIRKFNVSVFKEGDDIIDLVTNTKPDLILMDIQLSGLSGIDLIKELKARNDTKNIPIIAITAFAMKHDESRILQAGCDFYVSKPVSIKSFFNAIYKFLPQDNLNLITV